MIEQRILAGLMQRGIPLHIAQGIAANMKAESRLDPGINEIAPLVAGSRGGFGLNQWTGPRRRALEAEAQRRGVPVDDLDFQLDYTLMELRGPESAAWNALSQAQTAEDAARIYSERFLRPGIPHMDARLAFAREFAGMEPDANALAPPWFEYAGQQGPQGQPQDPRNALAPPEEPQLRMVDTRQDPSAFFRQGNALAMAPIMYERRNSLGSLT